MNNINLPPNERWIDGYDGIYSVTESGEIYSYKCGEKKALKGSLNSNKYFTVSLCKNGIKKTNTIHRFVIQAFLGNQNNLFQVNHIDGNKKNNDLKNLEWCTQSHNARHSRRIGLQECKLSLDDVNKIKILISGANHSLRQIGRIFNVSGGCINGVKTNRNLKRFQ